jgi:hypothetical protein
MKLTLTMEMDNAAFGDHDYERGDEVGRLLGKVGEKISDGYTEGGLMDYNGNTVGHWEVTE